MIKIGYCSAGKQDDLHELLSSHPIFHPAREDVPGGPKAKRCPSFNTYVLSAFNVGIAYDMKFRVRQTENKQHFVEYDRKETTLPEPSLPNAVSLEDFEEGIIQLPLIPFWMFISDEPGVVMTVQAAQGQTNPEPIRGQLNIYDWIRPSSYAFRATLDEWVTIKKSSPIYQVKFFHPNETYFTLSECEKTDDIFRLEQYKNIHSVVGSNSLSKWKEIWEFNRKRRPKKLLNFLEDK
jgi:hypothetical protein